MPFTVHRISGLVYGQHNKDVAFLESAEVAGLDAMDAFVTLQEKHRIEILNKFDYWKRDGHNDQWFHGFNAAGYRECFVFKRKQAGTYYRFYGFLINPRPITEARYRLCILASHGQKNQAQTDPSELDFINGIRIRADVIAAVKKEFPEKRGGANAALHVSK